MQDCNSIQQTLYEQNGPIMRNNKEVIGIICQSKAGSLGNNGNIEEMEREGRAFTIIYKDGIERVNWLPRMC